jgi:glycerophosphoryl diester phosphodiesterase
MSSSQNPTTASLALLAHRGYQAVYPENTCASLVAAMRAGASNIEFDVQLSQDLVPMVVHDDNLERTAGVSVLVSQSSAIELQSIEVAERDRLGEAGAGIFMPTLAAVADELKCFPDVTAFVELKRQSMEVFGVETMVDRVLTVLQDVLDQCVIISFDAESLSYLKERLPQQPIGWVLREWSEESHALADTLQPQFMIVNYQRVPSGASLWAGNWRWVCYDIIDPDMALEWHARGFAIISTFDIGGMIAALGNREQAG